MARVPYKGSPSVDASMTPLPSQNMPHVDLTQPGQELANLGKAFQGLGSSIVENQVKAQDRQNDAVISDLSVRGQAELRANQSEYELKQGADAINGYDPYIKKQEETAQRWQQQADAQGNPEVSRRFKMTFDPHVGTSIVWGAGHKGRQQKDYENKSSIAAEANAVDNAAANYRDPYVFERSMNEVRQAVDTRAKIHGWDLNTKEGKELHEAELRAATDKVYSARIKGYAKQDPIEARRLLEENRGVIGGKTQIDLDLHINEQEANIQSQKDAAEGIETGNFPELPPVAPPAPNTDRRSEAPSDPVDPLSPAQTAEAANGMDPAQLAKVTQKTDEKQNLQPGAEDTLGEGTQYAQAKTASLTDVPQSLGKSVPLGAVKDQGNRPPRYTGEIALGNSKFTFTSGGGKTPSAPYGTYPITPGKEGPIIRGMGGITLNNNVIYDPALKRDRLGIALHPASGADNSAGCLIIPDGQWPQFKRELQAKMASEGPQYITINPDGSSFISAKPGRLAGEGAWPQGKAFGLNQKRINEVSQGPNGSIIASEANKLGYDTNKLMTYISIESSGRANARTGSYHGLGQLSQEEFNRYEPGGNIYDPAANTRATIKNLQALESQFNKKFGRDPTATELYMMHQQGAGGASAHFANPDRPAWQNMASTAEGRQRGEAWAKRAIWGNIPDDEKRKYGRVENVKSADLINTYDKRITGGYGQREQLAAISDWTPADGDSADRAGVTLPASLGEDRPRAQAPVGPVRMESFAGMYAQVDPSIISDATGAPVEAIPFEGPQQPKKELVSPGPLRENSGPEWIEQMTELAKDYADRKYPGNVRYKDNLLRSLYTKYNTSRQLAAQKQQGNYRALMNFVVGDYEENIIRSMDVINNDPEKKAAFDSLSSRPDLQSAIVKRVEANSKKDIVFTRERQEKYQQLKGMAVNQPDIFVSTPITDLPIKETGELTRMQDKIKQRSEQSTVTLRVMDNVGPILAGAGIYKQYNSPGRMNVYNEFTGAMAAKVEEYMEVNKKSPVNDLEWQHKTTAALLLKKNDWSIFDPSTWLNDTDPNFRIPSKMYFQGEMKTQDEMKKIYRDKFGEEATRADMYRMYQRSLIEQQRKQNGR